MPNALSHRPVQTPRAGTPWKSVFSLLVALFYGASPIDLIPDFIPLLGLMDDAVIVPMFLLLAFVHYRKAKKKAGVRR